MLYLSDSDLKFLQLKQKWLWFFIIKLKIWKFKQCLLNRFKNLDEYTKNLVFKTVFIYKHDRQSVIFMFIFSY